MATAAVGTGPNLCELHKVPATVYIGIPQRPNPEQEIFKQLAEHERFLRECKSPLSEADVKRIQKDLDQLLSKKPSEILARKIAEILEVLKLQQRKMRKSVSLPSLAGETPPAMKKSPSKAHLVTKASQVRAAYNSAVACAREVRKTGTAPSQYRTIGLGAAFPRGAPVRCTRLVLNPLPNVQGGDCLYFLYYLITNSTIASKLLDDAKKEAAAYGGGSLFLRSAKKADVPFGGRYLFLCRQIVIDHELPRTLQLKALIFELANAVYTKKFMDIHKKAKEGGFANGDDYATAIEAVEFESAAIYTKIVRECIEKEKWDAALDVYKWRNFQECLAAQKASGHYRQYVEYFNKNFVKKTT